jgi:hypothetical protein
MSAFVCDFKPRIFKGEDVNPYSPFSKHDTYTEALETAIQKTHNIVSRVVSSEIQNAAYLNPLSE